MTEEINISYTYLMKRALKISVEFIIIVLALYFLPEIIAFFQFIYGF